MGVRREERERERERERDRGQGMVDTRSPMVHTRVVLARCPKICIRDGHANWKRDRCQGSLRNTFFLLRRSYLARGQFPRGVAEG